MSTLLDKFKLKTPAKIAKIRIRMTGKQSGESSESSEDKLNVNIFEERMKGRFTKPSIQITEFKKDEKIINKPVKLSKKLRIPGKQKKIKKPEDKPKINEPFSVLEKNLLKLKTVKVIY